MYKSFKAGSLSSFPSPPTSVEAIRNIKRFEDLISENGPDYDFNQEEISSSNEEDSDSL